MDGRPGVARRPDKFEHYLNRAKVAAERGTCLRRKVGAIVVKDDVEVSSGYVGAPRGTDNCCDLGKCLRIEAGIPSGQRYELCRSVHAEQNAIVNAARSGIGIKDGEMYISSEKLEEAYRKEDLESPKIYGPCMICKKEIINAGLKAVHMREEGIGVKSYTIEELQTMLDDEEKRLAAEFMHSRSKHEH
jgi:dCMP deaminase